ncbi:MAG TPA: TylF/MycF/NovP-related O-methyltransferase [Opitutaceae bacterium]|nr:TylF/MycF/NovP-related O-methyltransferase [Opitutaceae bacterium]
MKQLIRQGFRRFGFDLVRFPPSPPDEMAAVRDLPPADLALLTRVRPFTMTSVERMAALLDAVAYVSRSKIPGDIAECGVWRGGSMMLIALALLARGDTSRSLYLYDTFDGMPPPTSRDANFAGEPARGLLEREPQRTGIWCYASREDVQANLWSTGYPREKIHFIKGKVEDTIPTSAPGQLALLRLDTDWYESTRHELTHLYPLLPEGGVLVIDDYGHWQGARKAVDEYFERDPGAYLQRVDYTGRLLVKRHALTHDPVSNGRPLSP